MNRSAAWHRGAEAGAPAVPSYRGSALVFAGIAFAASPWDRVFVAEWRGFTLRLTHLAFLLAAAAAWRACERPRDLWRAWLRAGTNRALVALAAWCALSLAWSAGPVKSLGYAAWAWFCVFAMAFGGYLLGGLLGWRMVRDLWFCGALVTLAGAMLELVAATITGETSVAFPDGMPRLRSVHAEPAYLALFLTPYAAYSGLAAAGTMAPAMPFARGAFMAIAIVLLACGSRSGWLALAVILAAMAMRALVLSARAKNLTGLWDVLAGHRARIYYAAGALASLAFFPILWTGAAAALDFSEGSSTLPRLRGIAQGLRVAYAALPLGTGAGAYGAFLAAHPALVIPGEMPAGIGVWAVVTPNLWIEVLAELGLPGILLLGAWFLLAVRSLRAAAPNHAEAAGLLLGWAVIMLLDFQFNQTLWRADFWPFVAVIGAFLATHRGPSATTSHRY